MGNLNKTKNLKKEDSVVKIDSILLKEIETFIQKPENRLKFVNKKQFIDLAVDDFLNKLKQELKHEKKQSKADREKRGGAKNG